MTPLFAAFAIRSPPASPNTGRDTGRGANRATLNLPEAPGTLEWIPTAAVTPESFNFFVLFMHADWVVKLVMLGLGRRRPCGPGP